MIRWTCVADSIKNAKCLTRNVRERHSRSCVPPETKRVSTESGEESVDFSFSWITMNPAARDPSFFQSRRAEALLLARHAISETRRVLPRGPFILFHWHMAPQSLLHPSAVTVSPLRDNDVGGRCVYWRIRPPRLIHSCLLLTWLFLYRFVEPDISFISVLLHTLLLLGYEPRHYGFPFREQERDISFIPVCFYAVVIFSLLFFSCECVFGCHGSSRFFFFWFISVFLYVASELRATENRKE